MKIKDMKITARLAYSQLKKNKTRTRGALWAIALSTALTTAVCSFPASANSLMTGSLGNGYGDYGRVYRVLLFPVIFLVLIIAGMSIIVISNVFRVSAGERIAEFGILKCVGATGKQIQESVIYESVLLSLWGIPLGVAMGLVLDYLAVQGANLMLDELNALVHMMVNEFYLSFDFVIAWEALLASAIVSFLTVLVSAWLPARKAAVVSAVDSVRGRGTVIIDKRAKRRVSPVVTRFFGYEGELAVKNSRRNRRSFRATVSALSIGVLLFILLASVVNIAGQMEALMNINLEQTVIVDYTSARRYQMNEQTGERESVYLKPIDSTLGNEIARELQTYDGGEIFGIGMDNEIYSMKKADMDKISEHIHGDWLEMVTEEGEAEGLSVEIITLDEVHYRQLCEAAGVQEGAVILLNYDSFVERGRQIEMEAFLSTLGTLTLQTAKGSSKEVKIDAMLTKEEIPQELFYANTKDVRLILPDAMVRGYSWYASPKDLEGFMEYAGEVMAERFPEDETAAYMDNGFSTRVYETKDYSRVMNIAIMMVLVFLYTFAILLLLIGFTNVFSTISTNVLMRDREFAVLQSVGMTLEGLKRMLCLESILCSLRALAIGVPMGLLLTYVISIPVGSMYPIPYQIPWLTILWCVIGVFGITLGITWLSVRKLGTRNIIEAIRQQSGR